jgi:co-chaperonin GroES (HSP10)
MLNLKKVKPMFNRIITTADIWEEDQYINGIIDTSRAKGALKEHQKVLAVGTTVRDIKEGDVVCVDPTRYTVVKHNDKSIKNNIIGDNPVVSYRFDTIKLDGKQCLVLYDQDIKYIVEDSEEIEDSGHIIIPDKPNIIV